MKRRITALLSLIILLTYTIIPMSAAFASTVDKVPDDDWPDGPGVNAESAIVMEASTGLVLYEKNIDADHFPASITKIMTALLAIENSSLGDIVTFSHNAIYDVDPDSSKIGMDVGEQLTMQQCLYALLLESDNQVSYAIAEHVGGTIENFAKMMNDRAKSLGCKNTNFVNPNGLPDDKHITSAYDMALITREAMKNPTFAKIFSTRTYQIPPTNIHSEVIYLANHHKFILNRQADILGGKTGYTSKAKYTLVTVAKRGDLELICVIMRDDTSDHQYSDTKELFDFAFDNFSIYPIGQLESDQILSESPMFTRFNSLLSETDSPITTDKNGYLVLPNTASFEDAKKEVSFYPSSEISNGSNMIGKISYTYHDRYVGGADIIYNNLQQPTLSPVSGGETRDPAKAPESSNNTKPEKSGQSLRPIVIGAIIGLFVIIIILYFLLVEHPRIRRRRAYYKKRAYRKLHHNDDYLDL